MLLYKTNVKPCKLLRKLSGYYQIKKGLHSVSRLFQAKEVFLPSPPLFPLENSSVPGMFPAQFPNTVRQIGETREFCSEFSLRESHEHHRTTGCNPYVYIL